MNEKPKIMKTKKSSRKGLEKFRVIFFEFGMVVALSLVLLAFEWKTYDFSPIVFFNPSGSNGKIELPPITEHKKEKPIPKKIKPKAIPAVKEVKNDQEDTKITGNAGATQDDQLMPKPDDPKLDIETNVVDPVYKISEVMPEFPGGLSELYKYVYSNINYNQEAVNLGIQGKVFVRFIIEKDGTASNVEILKGLGFGLDKEVKRVIHSMPPWKPGMQGGLKVRVEYVLPVKFSLADF